jgi:hypothetical protein
MSAGRSGGYKQAGDSSEIASGGRLRQVRAGQADVLQGPVIELTQGMERSAVTQPSHEAPAGRDDDTGNQIFGEQHLLANRAVPGLGYERPVVAFDERAHWCLHPENWSGQCPMIGDADRLLNVSVVTSK